MCRAVAERQRQRLAVIERDRRPFRLERRHVAVLVLDRVGIEMRLGLRLNRDDVAQGARPGRDARVGPLLATVRDVLELDPSHGGVSDRDDRAAVRGGETLRSLTYLDSAIEPRAG